MFAPSSLIMPLAIQNVRYIIHQHSKGFIHHFVALHLLYRVDTTFNVTRPNTRTENYKQPKTFYGLKNIQRDGVSIVLSRNRVIIFLSFMIVHQLWWGRSCLFFALFIFALNLNFSISVSIVLTKLPTAITTSKIPQTTTWQIGKHGVNFS